MKTRPSFLVMLCIFTVVLSTDAQNGREGKVPREGFDLFYREYGSGAPLVVLSGGPGFDCDYMMPVAAEISKTNRAILIELRGTGRSLPKSINPDTVNLKAYLSDLEALRTHLKLDRWTLLGHSAGGMLSMHYAAAYPEHVDRLVLAGPGPIATQFADAQGDNAMMRMLPEEKEELRNPNLSRAEAIRIALPGSFFDRSKALQMAKEFNPESFHEEVSDILLRELMPPKGGLRPDLRDFNRPVLIVAGRQDPLDPVAQYETHLALRNSTLRFIPRCGHFPWIEQPDEFFRVVHEFLNESAKR
jgi:proline iminopeptidase